MLRYPYVDVRDAAFNYTWQAIDRSETDQSLLAGVKGREAMNTPWHDSTVSISPGQCDNGPYS